jgi:hypothetical protein
VIGRTPRGLSDRVVKEAVGSGEAEAAGLECEDLESCWDAEARSVGSQSGKMFIF